MNSKVIFIAAVALLAACGSKDEKENGETPVEVKVETVTVTGSETSQLYTGTIEAGKTAELSFIGGGTITRIPIEEGMRVGKGQLIAEVNHQVAADELKNALADERKATNSYNRYKDMYESKSLPESQWVEVQNTLDQARAQVNIARKQVSDCRLTAPFAGYVTTKDAENGQNVSAGKTVATISDISKVKVSINIPSTDMASFRQGQRISITVPELGSRSFTAVVTEKGIEADEFTRSYTIKAVVNNSNGLLLPGMICSLTGYKVSSGASVIIPEKVVQIDFDNSHFVWVVKDGKAVRRIIHTGKVTPHGVIVTSGLTTGDKIIVEGEQKVYREAPPEFCNSRILPSPKWGGA